MSELARNLDETLPLRDRPIPEITSVLSTLLNRHNVAYAIGKVRNQTYVDEIMRANATVTPEIETTLRDMAETTERMQLADPTLTPRDIQLIMIRGHASLMGVEPIVAFNEGNSHVVVQVAEQLAIRTPKPTFDLFATLEQQF